MKNKNWFAAILLSLASATGLIVYEHNYNVHVDKIPKSNIFVIIDPGHGALYNNNYLTAGKQSPEFPCGLKIYEGYSNLLLALDLKQKLLYNHIDVFMSYDPIKDLSLRQRVNIINQFYDIDNRVILLSIHHNAQPTHNANYIDSYGVKGFINNRGAAGIEIFTYIGWTESDHIADNFIFPALENEFPDEKFRFNNSTQKNKEANFYILKNTKCPAVLIEWLFMTTYEDAIKINDHTYRDRFTNALLYALIDYNNSLINEPIFNNLKLAS